MWKIPLVGSCQVKTPADDKGTCKSWWAGYWCPGAGRPRGTSWQEAGGQLGWPWQPTAPCAVGQKPGPLHQPVLPCPGQGFRAKQLVLRRWCPPLEPLEGFPVTAAWPRELDVHCLLGKKISWCDGTQEKWCCPPKGMMLVHSKPVLWRGTRHHKGKQLENFLQRCTELSYSAIIKTLIWVAMHHSGGTKVQGS